MKLDKFTCLDSILLLYLGLCLRQRDSKVLLVREGVGEHIILELQPDFLQGFLLRPPKNNSIHIWANYH